MFDRLVMLIIFISFVNVACLLGMSHVWRWFTNKRGQYSRIIPRSLALILRDVSFLLHSEGEKPFKKMKMLWSNNTYCTQLQQWQAIGGYIRSWPPLLLSFITNTRGTSLFGTQNAYRLPISPQSGYMLGAWWIWNVNWGTFHVDLSIDWCPHKV